MTANVTIFLMCNLDIFLMNILKNFRHLSRWHKTDFWFHLQENFYSVRIYCEHFPKQLEQALYELEIILIPSCNLTAFIYLKNFFKNPLDRNFRPKAEYFFFKKNPKTAKTQKKAQTTSKPTTPT